MSNASDVKLWPKCAPRFADISRAACRRRLSRPKPRSRPQGLKYSVTSHLPPIPASHEGVFALALREAVTNIIRHAGAKSCNLRLEQTSNSCCLEIKDDGCGELEPEGVGLSGMRQRVEALGGSLRRESSSGTRLIITLPAPLK